MTTPQLECSLRDSQSQVGLVVLDLRDLAFMDCSGAHAIVNASISARQLGRRLVLLRGPPDVGRVFTLTGSSDAVEIADFDPAAPPVQALPRLAAADRASMSATAALLAAAEAVPSVHEMSVRVVRALVFGVAPAALGVGGGLAWGGSLHLTTVVFVSLAMVAAVVIAAAIVDERNARGYGARQAWRSATVLTVGSMVRRGLAKSGRRDRHTDGR